MSRMTHARMWDLVVPCAHDSITFKLKNYLPDPVKRFIKTQNKTIADQLSMGVREFDIRICKYWRDLSAPEEIWTSHTALCQPLNDVLKVLKEFITVNQSEIIIINVKADTTPINLDQFTDGREIVKAFDTDDRHYRSDIIKYIYD